MEGAPSQSTIWSLTDYQVDREYDSVIVTSVDLLSYSAGDLMSVTGES